MPDSGSSDPSYQLNARLLRYRSRPGSEEPKGLIEDLLNAGRFGDARGVAVLEQTENPEDVRFVVAEGRAWLLEKDLARAQAVLLRGIKVDPQSAEAYRWLGEVLLERGDVDRALKAVQRGLSIDARHTELLRLQARATRAAEAGVAGGLVIDVPASAAREPTEQITRPRPTASPPARPRSATPKDAPAIDAPLPPPAPVPKAVLAPPRPAPVARPPEKLEAPAPQRSVTPPKPRPAAAAEARARDNTLQGLFGAGASLPSGAPIAERRTTGGGGTLPFPSATPTPAPVSSPAPVKPQSVPIATIRPPKAGGGKGGTTPGLLESPKSAPPARESRRVPETRESLGESLERVEISPRSRVERPSSPAGTTPGLTASPLTSGSRASRASEQRVSFEPPAPNRLSWDDDQGEIDTGEHQPIESSATFLPIEDSATFQPIEAPIDEPPTLDRRVQAAASHVPEHLPIARPAAPRIAPRMPSPVDEPAPQWNLPRGAMPAETPDVTLGGDAGAAEDVDAVLDMLRRQGIFEPPTGRTSLWAKRDEVPRTGTKLTTVLIGVWVATLVLAVGGYFGWQQYVTTRHAEAASLTQQALAGIASGEHEALVDAERNLRLAHEAHPMSAQVAQSLLLLHAVRALEDGTGDASALRAMIAGATGIASRLKEMGEKTTVSSAYLAAAQATSAALNGELASARTSMGQALATGGKDFVLQYWVGRTAQRIGEPAALDELRAAADGSADLFAAALAVAELEREAGLQQEALARVQKVLEKKPTHLRARLWRAYLMADQEAPDAALTGLDAIAKDLERGAAADRVVEAMTRARLLRRAGKSDAAGELVANAMKLGATDPRLLALVAEEARRTGKLGVAQLAATQAVNGAPAVAAYRRLLADVLIDRQDGARALTILEQLSNDEPEVLVMRARAALLLGTKEALSKVGEALDAYVAANPAASVRVKALRIRARVQLEANPAVLKEAEKLTKDAPGDADALLALGEAALELREGAIADRALTSLVKVAPETVRAYYLLGRVKRLNGDADGAEANLRKTLELASNHTEALMALGSLLLDRAKYADADALYQELATRSGEAHLGRLGRVEALIGLGQLDDAQVQWEGVAERFRDTASARQIGAKLALSRGKPGEALTLLQPLTQGEDRRASVMSLYGDALYAAEQVDAAAGAYDAALELDNGLPEALIGRGEVEVRAEKPDEALEHLLSAKQALKERIRPPELAARMWLLIGRAYIQRDKRGDLDEARAALEQATAIEQVSPVAFFWLGESWAGKNTPEARAAYERYMQLAPEGEFAGRARKALAAR